MKQLKSGPKIRTAATNIPLGMSLVYRECLQLLTRYVSETKCPTTWFVISNYLLRKGNKWNKPLKFNRLSPKFRSFPNRDKKFFALKKAFKFIYFHSNLKMKKFINLSHRYLGYLKYQSLKKLTFSIEIRLKHQGQNF